MISNIRPVQNDFLCPHLHLSRNEVEGNIDKVLNKMFLGNNFHGTDLHMVKSVNPYFYPVWNETKTAEFRKLDRDYKVDDLMACMHYSVENALYSGEIVIIRITHITHDCPLFGIPQTHGMLSFDRDIIRIQMI